MFAEMNFLEKKLTNYYLFPRDFFSGLSLPTSVDEIVGEKNLLSERVREKT